MIVHRDVRYIHFGCLQGGAVRRAGGFAGLLELKRGCWDDKQKGKERWGGREN
jgi:hypothetical protein